MKKQKDFVVICRYSTRSEHPHESFALPPWVFHLGYHLIALPTHMDERSMHSEPLTLTMTSRWQSETPVSWDTLITLPTKHIVFTIALPKNDICTAHVLIAITIISNTDRKTITGCKVERTKVVRLYCMRFLRSMQGTCRIDNSKKLSTCSIPNDILEPETCVIILFIKHKTIEAP